MASTAFFGFFAFCLSLEAQIVKTMLKSQAGAPMPERLRPDEIEAALADLFGGWVDASVFVDPADQDDSPPHAEEQA